MTWNPTEDDISAFVLLLYMLIGSTLVVNNINNYLPDEIRVLGMFSVVIDVSIFESVFSALHIAAEHCHNFHAVMCVDMLIMQLHYTGSLLYSIQESNV